MASIADFREIIQNTPVEQAILLKGIHGIGKSESIKSSMEELGYRMVTLFLGQAADAGDIVGLPDKREVKMEIGGVIDTFNITDYNPPKWWPFDMNEKVIIFLDEINRGKPEIMQCIMDMVLNRVLNGRALPHQTRIIAAMNPTDDGYYQVEDLDPALLDRFNVYDFKPTNDEWIAWAGVDDRVHKVVVGFIAKHSEMLDPPSSKDTKAGDINPSRRSWVRVSNIIKGNPKLLEGSRKILKNMILGIVGTKATAAFDKYVAEVGSGMTPELVLTRWDAKVGKKVKDMSMSESIHLNGQICTWLKDHTADMKKKSNSETTMRWLDNLKNYIDIVHVEAKAAFFSELAKQQAAKEEWPRLVLGLHKTVSDEFLKTIRGEN